MPDFRENLVKILLLFVVITIILTFANAIILSILRNLLRGRKKTEVAPASTVTKEIIRERIIKEVVMVPCSNCGGLMPQTAIFCPTCGVRRKA